jgi:hypothetical protein
MNRILLKTTIPATADDWSIARFALLAQLLSEMRAPRGGALFDVVARDREEDAHGDDRDLAALPTSDVDQLWLFAVDEHGGLSAGDCGAITTFRERGGGVLSARDHQDTGACVGKLSGLGRAHHFQQFNPEPDPERCVRDDRDNALISWPNYHSGRNGDFQWIDAVAPHHALLVRDGRPIRRLPAHPHEGAVSAPSHTGSRVIARGTSLSSGRAFNLVVAFESTAHLGRALAVSTFHQFADYNWNPAEGAPSFVTEMPGDGLRRDPEALADVHAYARNVALWLSHEI